MLPLSEKQKDLFVEQILHAGAPLLNVGGYVWITGPVDRIALEAAAREVIACNEALRVVLRRAGTDGSPVQEILPQVDFSLPVQVVPTEDAALAWLSRFTGQPFELFDQLLYRFALVAVSPERHALAVVFHHIVGDGVTVMLTIQRIAETHDLRQAGKSGAIPGPSLAEHVERQRARLQAGQARRAEDYWSARFSPPPPPVFRKLASSRTGDAAVAHLVEVDLPPHCQKELSGLAAAQGGNAFQAFLVAVYGYLGQELGVSDFMMGVSLANRRTEAEKRLIALAASVVPVRLAGGFQQTFATALQEVGEELRRAYRHVDVSLGAVAARIGLLRSGRTGLFDVSVSWFACPYDRLSLGTAQVEMPYQLISSYDSKPLQIFFNPIDPGRPPRLSLVCNALYFTKERALALAEGLRGYITFLARNPGAKLTGHQSKPAPVAYVHELIEACAKRDPMAIAVMREEMGLSYADLVNKANVVAHRLRRLGIGPDSVVGVVADRSLEMIVAILGVLKAGGAFMPLDPAYPVERLTYMLRDQAASCVLVGRGVVSSWPRLAELPQLRIVAVELEKTNEQIEVAHPNLLPDHLAYVIYTSGSTGAPKGVWVTHRGWRNLVDAQHKLFEVGPGDRVLQFARLSFDASVWEMVMALCTGATLCLASADQLAPGKDLAGTLTRQRISVATLPPSVLAFLENETLPHLRTVISAGEACPISVARKWAARGSFFNAYGPTEVTVCATAGRFGGGEVVPLGPPLSGMAVRILDSRLGLVPAGAVGELYICGHGLARGYANAAGLTAQRFVANPFEEGQRMYRSGDLVRLRPEHGLEFVGRTDEQFKLRGFRIDPGEIERVLSQHEAVVHAAVIKWQPAESQARLIAYVTLRADRPGADTDALRLYLRERLPDYLVPAAIVVLESMPVTANGKLDKHRLPSPAAVLSPTSDAAEPASLAQRVARIWAEVLRKDKLPANVNFFDLGADSLLMARALQLLNAQLSMELTFVQLLENPTIGGLTRYIEALRREGT